MYSIYDRHQNKGQIRLALDKEISLAGCRNGLIHKELKKQISESDSPPVGWKLNIADKYNKNDKSIIIDIKPGNNEVFLCELDTVFGFSYPEWTPIMYRLIRLYSDLRPNEFDKRNFVYPDNPEVIYTILYMRGSFANGQLTGTWNPPFGSTTALLFWPEAMTFFNNQISQIDPNFLNSKVDIIEKQKRQDK